jgi:cytochrome c-type biogenesis protein CcmH
MSLFWPLVALLILGTLAALLRPLLRADVRADAPAPEGAAIAVLRDQKRAVDAQCEAGEISAGEREAAMADLARRAASEIDATEAQPSMPSRRAWTIAIMLAMVVPATALLLYARLGHPGDIVGGDGAAGHEVSEKQILAMVDGLAARLKEHPEDANGWVLLARSYLALERFPAASDAYAHAVELIPDDANLLADYADVLAMTQNRTLAGKPATLVERALAIDPKNRKALALAATAALEARDTASSLAYWRRLAAELPPGSEQAQQVASFIAEIGAQPAAPAPASSTRGATARAGAPSPANKAGTISGRVDIAPALTSKVALSDTVFIYARAAQGSRMPLAVLRIAARELPRDFSLDDSMAMAPGATLSGASEAVVEARISKSGNAIPQTGDLFGRSAPLKPGASGVRITIDQVVP